VTYQDSCSSCGERHKRVFVTDERGVAVEGLVVGETDDGKLVVETSIETILCLPSAVTPWRADQPPVDDFPDEDYDGGLGSGKWLEKNL